MKKLNCLLSLFFVLALAGCKKDDKNAEKITPPTAAAFQSMQENFLNGVTKTPTVTVGGIYTSPKGVKLTLSSVYNGNQPVTGAVNLKYIEMFDVGTIAFGNKPLIGNYVGTRAALVTGGEFFIEARQNGNLLNGLVNLEVPGSLTNNADEIASDMSSWTWDDEADEWKVEGERIKGGANANNIYGCWFPFGWTNIDWLYSLPGAKTPIRVKVPSGFDDKNCCLYAAYANMPNTLAPFDSYVGTGTGAPYFTEHTGIGPVGYRMHIVFISAGSTPGQAIYALKTVTLVQDEYINIYQSDLHSATIEGAIEAINGLYK